MNRHVVRSELHEPDVCCAGRSCRLDVIGQNFNQSEQQNLWLAFKTQDGRRSSVSRLIRSAPVLDQRFWLARYNPSHRRICLVGKEGGGLKHELTAQTPDKEPDRSTSTNMKTNIIKSWEHLQLYWQPSASWLPLRSVWLSSWRRGRTPWGSPR